MDYHSDRFEDHSLELLEEDRLIGLLPAARAGNDLVSHAGLTFGGIVSGRDMRAATMMQAVDALVRYARTQGIRRIVYKALPHIYHAMPAEEDLYALHRFGARLFRRDLSSTLRMANAYGLSKGRKWSLGKGRKSGIEVRRSFDFKLFMDIEREHLATKHAKTPVHSGDELSKLAGFFPDNIALYGAYAGDRLLGGVVIYESSQVAHAQYIAATDEGKEQGALDVILNHLLSDVYRSKTYFDFGISTEDGGQRLDEALIENKESFGARAVAYDFYELMVGS